MSYSISILLTRNLQEVFGENDPARRRATIDEIFTEDCVFYDPTKGVYRGATRLIASRARVEDRLLCEPLCPLLYFCDLATLTSPTTWE